MCVFDTIMKTSSNENISALLAICARNSPATGEFPAQRPVKLWCFHWPARTRTVEINNREGGDLRRHRNHYNVTVMIFRVGGRYIIMDV